MPNKQGTVIDAQNSSTKTPRTERYSARESKEIERKATRTGRKNKGDKKVQVVAKKARFLSSNSTDPTAPDGQSERRSTRSMTQMLRSTKKEEYVSKYFHSILRTIKRIEQNQLNTPAPVLLHFLANMKKLRELSRDAEKVESSSNSNDCNTVAPLKVIRDTQNEWNDLLFILPEIRIDGEMVFDEISLCLTDFETLSQKKHMSIRVIRFGLHRIIHQFNEEQKKSIYFMDISIYPRLIFFTERFVTNNGVNYTGTLNSCLKENTRTLMIWLEEVNLLTKKFIVFPLEIDYQWIFVVAVRPEKEDKKWVFIYGNSLSSFDDYKYRQISYNLNAFLKTHQCIIEKKQMLPTFFDFEVVTTANIQPAQSNLYDSGAHMLYMLEHIFCGSFNHPSMPHSLIHLQTSDAARIPELTRDILKSVITSTCNKMGKALIQKHHNSIDVHGSEVVERRQRRHSAPPPSQRERNLFMWEPHFTDPIYGTSKVLKNPGKISGNPLWQLVRGIAEPEMKFKFY